MSAPKLVMQPQASKVGWLGSQLPLDGTGDFTVTRASTATRINASGLLETVPANVPIIDHSNGCPELVVEPQVTQLFGMTEQFDNAYWDKINISITSNAIIAPDGSMTADKFVSGTLNGEQLVSNFKSQTGIVNQSIFVKKAEMRYAIIRGFTTGYLTNVFDFNTESFVLSDLGVGYFKKLNNGWYRIDVTYLSQSTMYATGFSFSDTLSFNYFGDGIKGGYLWGAQFQTGSVATSYIPNATTGTVTKVADVITGQTNASNFNILEGTLFVDIKSITSLSSDFRMITLSDGTINNIINIYHTPNANMVKLYFIMNGITKLIHEDYSTNINEFHKVAITYNSSNIKMYVNGVEKASSTGGSFSALTKINFMDESGLNHPFQGRVRSLKYYPTALTDAQIQAL